MSVNPLYYIIVVLIIAFCYFSLLMTCWVYFHTQRTKQILDELQQEKNKNRNKVHSVSSQPNPDLSYRQSMTKSPSLGPIRPPPTTPSVGPVAGEASESYTISIVNNPNQLKNRYNKSDRDTNTAAQSKTNNTVKIESNRSGSTLTDAPSQQVSTEPSVSDNGFVTDEDKRERDRDEGEDENENEDEYEQETKINRNHKNLIIPKIDVHFKNKNNIPEFMNSSIELHQPNTPQQNTNINHSVPVTVPFQHPPTTPPPPMSPPVYGVDANINNIHHQHIPIHLPFSMKNMPKMKVKSNSSGYSQVSQQPSRESSPAIDYNYANINTHLQPFIHGPHIQSDGSPSTMYNTHDQSHDHEHEHDHNHIEIETKRGIQSLATLPTHRNLNSASIPTLPSNSPYHSPAQSPAQSPRASSQNSSKMKHLSQKHMHWTMGTKDSTEWTISHKTELPSIAETRPPNLTFYKSRSSGPSELISEVSLHSTNSESGFGTTPTHTSRFNSSFNTQSPQFAITDTTKATTTTATTTTATTTTFKYPMSKTQTLEEDSQDKDDDTEDTKGKQNGKEEVEEEEEEEEEHIPKIVVYEVQDDGLDDPKGNTKTTPITNVSEDDTISVLSGIPVQSHKNNDTMLTVISDITRLTEISDEPIPEEKVDMNHSRLNTTETIRVNDDKSTYGIRTPQRSLLSIEDIYNGRSNTATTYNTLTSSVNTMISSSVYTSATTEISGDSLQLDHHPDDVTVEVETSRNTESAYDEYGKNDDDSNEFDLYI